MRYVAHGREIGGIAWWGELLVTFLERPGITSRLRLRGHDYSDPAYYFITICIRQRLQILGAVHELAFLPSDVGTMIEDYLITIPIRFPGTCLDTWCLMPNHLHLLLGVGVEDDPTPLLPSIPSIMDWFKSVTTVEYINGVKNLGWPRFDRYLWQPKYHDRVVRNDRELEQIRNYIANNPANWHEDMHFTEHPRS